MPSTAEAQAKLNAMSKMLEEFAKSLEQMNTVIMGKVDSLESAVVDRSKEIRDGFYQSHLDVIEVGRKLKEAMYEAELKDLDIQRKTLEILDDTEDKSIERASKLKTVFGMTAI